VQKKDALRFAEKVDISLQSTYRPEKIDKIFQRIEGFSDSPSEK
jgi:hypothetical protein